jgi:hypothetical protein
VSTILGIIVVDTAIPEADQIEWSVTVSTKYGLEQSGRGNPTIDFIPILNFVSLSMCSFSATKKTSFAISRHISSGLIAPDVSDDCGYGCEWRFIFFCPSVWPPNGYVF